MADIALAILSTPTLCLYRGSKPAGYDLAWPRLISAGPIQSTLRIDGSNANGNASATLANGDGRLTAEFSDPPLRVEAIILRDGAEVFRGLITRVRLGADIELDLEA